jgi:putative ABC transport system permease protein
LGLLELALKRLRYRPGLTLLALIGVILAIGLVTSAGFFAQAVDQVILSQTLAEYSRVTNRPPFSTRVYAISSRAVPLSLERVEVLGQNVADTLSTEVGLPILFEGIQADSGVVKLFARSDSAQYATGKILRDPHLLYIAGSGPHLNIIEGEPLQEETVSGDILEVWMHTALAEEMGVQINDEFEVTAVNASRTFPVRIKGIWQARDPTDPFWFSDPDQLHQDKLLVRRQDYISHVEPNLPVKVRAVTWHIVLDEREVIPAKVRDYVAGFERGQSVINKYLPEARLTAPSLALEKFVRRQDTLTLLLLGFNVPAFGFLLYFLVLTSAVIAYWQRREVAMLTSRGMTSVSLLNLTLLEEVLIFIIGCPLGLLFGGMLARLMGYTDSFLSFSPDRPPLPISLLGLNLPLIILTLAVVLLARLWPALQSTGQTVLQQEREHSRPPAGPFWYRNYLDLLLIIPTLYAYDQLAQRGNLALLARDRPEDIFQDPLLVLVPALFVLVLALLMMRIFPLLMRLLDQVATLLPWLTPHLALRQLGRQYHSYINPLLLVIVSLALGVYTLSLAASLDQWLIDRMYYQVGADLTFEPFSESELTQESIGAAWIPSPAEFETLAGVEAATRVGQYPSEITLANNQRVKARFLALDRVDFPAVAWFRNDFSSEPLGGLMNRLALIPEGILVSQKFLQEHTLQIGDRLQINVVTDAGVGVKTAFEIVGTYHYFPTVYEDKVTIIGNLENLFTLTGLTMPHHIWLRAQSGTSGEAILKAVATTGIETINDADARTLIATALAEMERVGVFGTLSISFLAAALMAALGLLTYSYASLQERLFNFAMLRAMGAKRGQIIGQVFLEYALLTGYGAIAGALIGMVVTNLFVPLFRITGDLGKALPPLLPIIAQAEIIPLAVIFAGLMVALELLLIAFALYRRLFTALRMGYQG